MPYITPETRVNVAIKGPDSPGELNYALTLVLNKYIKNHGGLTYTSINDILGALEGVKLEFYRRVAVPYENTKLAENGDVYS